MVAGSCSVSSVWGAKVGEGYQDRRKAAAEGVAIGENCRQELWASEELRVPLSCVKPSRKEAMSSDAFSLLFFGLRLDKSKQKWET